MICAAFSIPVSPFVSDVNRATAQTIQLASSQEGLEPTKTWVKAIFDDIIQNYLGHDDLEFVWTGDDNTDPLEEAHADQILVTCGIKTIDEAWVGARARPVRYGIGPTVAQPLTLLLESLKAGNRQPQQLEERDDQA